MPTELKERRKIYSQRKKSSLCPRCGGKKKKNSKFIYCDDCREFFRNYNREISEDINEVRRSRYEQRKEKNCCPRCGTFIGKKSANVLCPQCLDKQYTYNTGAKRPKKKTKK